VFPYKAYSGKTLRVDLTSGEIRTVPLEREFAETWLGGNGFGTKILWDEVGPEIDALSPENRLIMATGPICGTLMPNSSRVAVIAKSPLTGIYGDSNAGGMFGPELKFAGYDMIVFVGRSPEPVYLWVDGKKVQVRRAAHLWGKSVSEAEKVIKAEVRNEDVKFATIGPAGENMVRYASIQITPHRSAARSGMGAVMGSKNLKSIVLRGSGGVSIARPADHYEVAYQAFQRIMANEFFPSSAKYGTAGLVPLVNQTGRFPTRNFQMGSFPYAEEIDAAALHERNFVSHFGCFNCPVACDKVYRVNEGKYAGTVTSSVEYETLSSLGSGVWVRDLDAILQSNSLCDELGMDTISAGRTIGFMMELWERGIITAADTGGVSLEWGDSEAVLTLLEQTARREGLGDLLAEGVRRIAARIGRGSEEYAMEVKGQEIAAQDGRAQRSMGLAHVTSTRGADHLKAFPTIDETGFPSAAVRRYGEQYMPEIVDPHASLHKPMLVKDGEEYAAIIDSSGNCKSGGTFHPPEIYWADMVQALQTATGMDLTVEQLKLIGERIYNLQRCYGVLHGISRKDDRLPRRFKEEPSPSGYAKGQTFDVEPLLEEYYRLRDWDVATGIPTRAKLAALGLEDAADRLGIGRGVGGRIDESTH
jgi:aldehyde:ferredoxin oxidoreductase